MPAPGILTGSHERLELFRTPGGSDRTPSASGVFGPNPGATPKFALNANRNGSARDAEYKESMARLFIEVPAERVDEFLASVSPETRPLARVLMSGAGTGGSGGTGFIDFLMTSANEAFDEKAQIVDTLTDNYVAFYAGQAPPVFNYAGTVLNTYQDDQRVWMLRLYQEILRGTRLANRNLIARLRYDSFIVSGYLENLRLGITGDSDHTAGSFQFSMRVKRLNIFTPSLGSPTVVQTPATTNSILEGTPTLEGSNERAATIAPETPPTTTNGPAAGSRPVTIDEETRAQLRALGLADATIDETVAEADEQRIPPEVDPREQEVVATQEGRDRVEETVRGTDGEINPDNITRDGSSGLTNVRGDTTQIDWLDAAVASTVVEAPLQRRTSNRRRGGIPVP